MKRLISWIGKVFALVATWVSHISLRGFVVITGLLLALTASQHHQPQFVDNLLIRANSYLFSPPLGSADIAIINVPETEMAIWQADIHSSGKLAALLSNVLNSPDSVVGLLMQQPIDTGSGAADNLIELFSKQSSASKLRTNAKTLVDRKYLLMDYLNNGRVVIGVEKFFFSGQKPLLNDVPIHPALPSLVNELFAEQCGDCFSFTNSVAAARPKVDQYSVMTTSWPQRQLVFFSPENAAYGGFLLRLLRVIYNTGPEKNLEWKSSQGISLETIEIPLSTTGRFIPVHALTERLAPIIETISLEEALARSAFPGTVFIAAEGSEAAHQLAASVYSIRNTSVLYSPWWTSLAMLGLMLFVTLYLGLVMARVSLRTATLFTASLILLMLCAQTVAIVTRAYWLPIALPVTWLLAGHFLLVVWAIKKRRVQNLIARADDICIDNARQLLIKRELDEAVEQLKDCTTREPLLQTLYEISEAYTEQKRYAQAVDVLSTVHSKQKKFKDTEQKLQVLKTMLKTTAGQQQSASLDKTKVMGGAGRMPSKIGRYQLEREIGRGAMGRVYLGFDPRISRRVAIKTLSYDQFGGKERNEIKARFFREAEAAGRLSHPSIVSVFDVGEQRNLAFIAMDFAEGKALNNFVSRDTLLPVFEVYRLVCDVAIALEYAHENNIVHRDVKPGNIIYNPSPYQIKVTDFGIARLVDNSKTSTGEILGSPLYMAPEQLKGKKVNRAADIFSLGVTFYQLLTGHLPYSGENLAALTYEIIHGRHKSVRALRKDLPLSASRIVNQALQKDPGDRYETAAEMAMVLKKAIRRDFAGAAKRAGYV